LSETSRHGPSNNSGFGLIPGDAVEIGKTFQAQKGVQGQTDVTALRHGRTNLCLFNATALLDAAMIRMLIPHPFT